MIDINKLKLLTKFKFNNNNMELLDFLYSNREFTNYFIESIEDMIIKDIPIVFEITDITNYIQGITVNDWLVGSSIARGLNEYDIKVLNKWMPYKLQNSL